MQTTTPLRPMIRCAKQEAAILRRRAHFRGMTDDPIELEPPDARRLADLLELLAAMVESFLDHGNQPNPPSQDPSGSSCGVYEPGSGGTPIDPPMPSSDPSNTNR